MTYRNERNHQNDRLKLVVSICAVTFTVTLAIIIGNRLDNESLAVLAGAVCGVGAAIPTSLLVIAVTRRSAQQTNHVSSQPTAQPPVVVVAPPGTIPQALPSPQSHIPMPLSIPTQRTFTVVGDGYEE